MPVVTYTINKASRCASRENYQSQVLGQDFDSYWLAIAVAVLLTYSNRVGFEVATWENGAQVGLTKISLLDVQQHLSCIKPEVFQQASVLVGKLYQSEV